MEMTEDKFTSIVEQTKTIVLSAIKSYLYENYYHAIDEVVQETYLRAYKGLIKDQFRGESKISTWLYTIAKNESIRVNIKFKKEELKKLKLMSLQEDDLFDYVQKENKYNLDELKTKIRLLPPIYESILSLSIAGYKEREIALKLSIPQGTVKSRANRGKKMLYQLIHNGGNDNGQT